MHRLVIGLLLLIPLSGIVTAAILVRDEWKARQSPQRRVR
jgi:hypothetical protein